MRSLSQECKVGLPFISQSMSGHLAGAVGRACDSCSQGYGFELHIECRDYLKTKSLKSKIEDYINYQFTGPFNLK